MRVSGSIQHGEVSTALHLLSRGRGTGVLVASTSFANASVGVLDGEIVWASATMGPKLGDVLVERGLVKRDRLDAALWVQRQDKEWRALAQLRQLKGKTGRFCGPLVRGTLRIGESRRSAFPEAM